MAARTETRRVFRLPALAYVPVLLVWIGALPVAFAAAGAVDGAGQVTIRTAVLVVPLVVTLFVARTATLVNALGIAVRAPFGRRVMRWDAIRGLAVNDRSVYAVLANGSVRLPCVRVSNLAELARASEGRLPEVAEPTPKYAPARKRRR